MKRSLTIEVVLLLLLATGSLAGIRRVPLDYPTIQDAINASTHGDTVLVAPGVYTGEGNRDINFKAKAITVKSENGPTGCIINCVSTSQGDYVGFRFNHGEDSNSVLQGFTITGRRSKYLRNFGGIQCFDSSPLIMNCTISRNIGWGVSASDSDLVMQNCLIAGNTDNGINIADGKPRFYNCTIIGNRGHGVYSRMGRGKLVLHNCIVVENGVWPAPGNQIHVGGCLTVVGCLDVQFKYCCVGTEPNAVFLGQMPPSYKRLLLECLQVNPLFVKSGYWDPNGTANMPHDDFWVDGDYHLKSQAGHWDPNGQTWVQDEITSPCIDTGHPAMPIGHEPFPNGGIINMGAYGGTVESSKSYFGDEVCTSIVAGDINGDCRVDFEDLKLLAMHWLWQGEPYEPETEPPGPPSISDPNEGRWR